MKKICYLGLGVWGFSLARQLSMKGHIVYSWTTNKELASKINSTHEHPKLLGFFSPPNLIATCNLEEALDGAQVIVEGVTSAGFRPVCKSTKNISPLSIPFIITSKGIEQNTGLLLSDIATEEFGSDAKKYIGCLSGPSIAQNFIQDLPCSVVCSGYTVETMDTIHELFSTPVFRIYPNSDLKGVELGGALKNIIAIACGISDGLHFGDNAKAGLITRGLHEMRRFAVTQGCRPETLNGLSGLGDLTVTCFSSFSRNYRCGHLIAQGLSFEEAKAQIGMVIEGAYTTVSVMQVATKSKLDLPITTVVHKILYENMTPKDGVLFLMQRITKEEYL